MMNDSTPCPTHERPLPPHRQVDAWERGWHLWDALFYALLALSLGVVLIEQFWTARVGLMIALSLALAAWHFALVVRAESPRVSLGHALLYFGGALPLWFALIWLDKAFFLVLSILFARAYGLLPLRWAFVVAAILTAMMVVRNAWGLSQSAQIAFGIFGLFTLVLGSWFAYWIASIIEQSAERRVLIEQLEATRRDLAASERQAGSMAERQRLAGEIHDTLAQGFVSIVLHLEAAEAALDRQPLAEAEALRGHLDDARRVARENLAEARRLVWALRPELLEGSSLAAALDRVVRRWGEEARVAAEFTVTGEERELPPERQVTLLRAAQEALANARKHAAASQVVVTLSFLDDTAILDVQDDGRGFNPDRLPVPGLAAAGGYGLWGMRERVAALGGTLSLESAPGDGTTLAVELPIEDRGGERASGRAGELAVSTLTPDD
jgi:signal transduction histidine kinase